MKILKRLELFTSMLGLIMAVTACQSSTPDTQPALPIPTPTIAVIQTATPLPTVAPGTFPTLMSDVPLAPGGPWLLFEAGNYPDYMGRLWATNVDGTGLTSLVDENVYSYSIQPGHSLKDGVLIAYMTSDSEVDGLTLKLLHLPDRQVQTVAELYHQPEGSPPFQGYNVYTVADLAWSPDGEQLAFSGELDGPLAAVYRYEVATQAISRISGNEEYPACCLMWSPDQQWIIYQLAYDIAAMVGPLPWQMWAVRVSGDGAVKLSEWEQGTDYRNMIGFTSYGWLDTSHLVFAEPPLNAMTKNKIKVVDITTSAAKTILSVPYSEATHSDTFDAWLLAPEKAIEDSPQDPVSLFHNGTLTDIQDVLVARAWWSDAYSEFFGVTEEGKVYTISLSGEVTEISTPDGWNMQGASLRVYPSPDGAYWAWSDIDMAWAPNASEVWVGKPLAMPVHIVKSQSENMLAQTITWSPDCRRLLIFDNGGLWVAEPPDFQLVQATASGGWTVVSSEWIP